MPQSVTFTKKREYIAETLKQSITVSGSVFMHGIPMIVYADYA